MDVWACDEAAVTRSYGMLALSSVTSSYRAASASSSTKPTHVVKEKEKHQSVAKMRSANCSGCRAECNYGRNGCDMARSVFQL